MPLSYRSTTDQFIPHPPSSSLLPLTPFFSVIPQFFEIHTGAELPWFAYLHHCLISYAIALVDFKHFYELGSFRRKFDQFWRQYLR